MTSQNYFVELCSRILCQWANLFMLYVPFAQRKDRYSIYTLDGIDSEYSKDQGRAFLLLLAKEVSSAVSTADSMRNFL